MYLTCHGVKLKHILRFSLKRKKEKFICPVYINHEELHLRIEKN